MAYEEETLSDHELLVRYEASLGRVARLRQEIESRIITRLATGIPDDDYTCEMPKRYTYFPERFAPFKEVLLDSELAVCYKPAWEEEIPAHVDHHAETWETVKLLAAARKHGEDAMRLVDNARAEARGNLVFRRRKV